MSDTFLSSCFCLETSRKRSPFQHGAESGRGPPHSEGFVLCLPSGLSRHLLRVPVPSDGRLSERFAAGGRGHSASLPPPAQPPPFPQLCSADGMASRTSSLQSRRPHALRVSPWLMQSPMWVFMVRRLDRLWDQDLVHPVITPSACGPWLPHTGGERGGRVCGLFVDRARQRDWLASLPSLFIVQDYTHVPATAKRLARVCSPLAR